MNARLALLLISIMASGLIAGLLYGWVVSVIPGLRKLDSNTYVTTMQNINREIINPWFVIPFMTVPLLLGATAVVEFRAGNDRRAWYIAAAAATYAFGVLGVTMGGNIPLNDSLDAVDLGSLSGDALDHTRNEYETPWNRWHNLRTAASVLAFALATTAAMINEAEEG